ncbi:RtcB family protein [Vitreoscilla massiliensis]|uniref:tRNA-splicing ligase RtcB n=1 Tax=Vitreoscilla massiliensis TaxID=1689272 RepID=A0ABY4E0T4_9NEIS|nr:RtcB family protein [Vitreoscilla massiliensis]UOO89350.1 RtcB family protein [Vitreoscilla massiliensis]
MSSFLRLQKRLSRLGIHTTYDHAVYRFHRASDGAHAQLLLPEALPLEEKAVLQLLDFAAVHLPEHPGKVLSARATPDFHPGSIAPVGSIVATSADMVIPAAIGTDINCGMRLIATGLQMKQLLPHVASLKQVLKALLLEDQRDLPVTPQAMWALFDQGLDAWLAALPAAGLWQHADRARMQAELAHILDADKIQADSRYAPEAFFEQRAILRPASLGTVGSGNHFVEIQVVDEILQRHWAYASGLKLGEVVIMVHTGSRDVGFYVGQRWQDKAKAAWPATEKYPTSGLFALAGSSAAEYLLAMGGAARYAWANRISITELVRAGLRQVLGSDHSRVVVDVSHNVVLQEQGMNIHRKGATPAHAGKLALIPGSMGDYSFVVAGLGHPDWLWSCSHGAGRSVRRQAMRQHNASEHNGLPFECITLKPERLREEAPQAYKAVKPVIAAQQAAGLLEPVARLKPWFTFKA